MELDGTIPPGSAPLIELCRLLETFNRDEVDAFLFLARKHAVGRAKYGSLDIGSETRDFRFEGANELADFLNYQSFWQLMRVLLERRAA